MKQFLTLLTLLILTPTFGQVSNNTSTGRVDEITTDFIFKIQDGTWNRPLIESRYVSGIGDYFTLKHGGNNTEENTFGFRISDGYGFDFGKNDFNESLLKIKTNGHVGIGTSNPAAKLEVRSSNNLRIWMNRDNQSSISFVPNNGNSIFHINHGLNNDLHFSQGGTVGATSIMTLKNMGNVGIGTTSPNDKLEVIGNVRSSSKFVVTGIGALEKNNSDFRLWSVNKMNFGSGISNTHMTINTNGFIGIGTVTPEENLHLKGTASIDGDIGEITTGGHWQQGKHTLELQNRDAGDVVLSFHRAGHTNAAIKHPTTGGLIFSATGGFDQNHMYLKTNGYLGIGTTNPDAKLTVKGNIHAEEVKIDLSVPAPDYVFTKDYDLLTIEEVQQHITEKGHLPNVPSAQELETNGVELGVMNMKLLEKIEELTLYTIAQEQKIAEQQKKIEKLEQQEEKIKELEQKLNTLLKSK
ncbi:tail fiber protein [Aquimarina brevivitae]|nr:tail fiber protein [Aquimarina brevivitae]